MIENLDLKCAGFGKVLSEIQNIKPKELENLITDALTVLEGQGIYAFFLFLKARDKGKETAKNIIDQCGVFLTNSPGEHPLLQGNSDIFDSLKNLSEDIDDLLLAHDLLRQSLVYARYHVKARSGEKEAKV